MNVLVISTSPRAGGNTDLLSDQVVRGATDVGANVEKLSLRRMNISPCTECGVCEHTGECAVNDDMQAVYAKLLDADRIVFATPIFFLGPSAQAKALIDRCQVFWSRKCRLEKSILSREFPYGRLGYLIATGGTRGQKIFECAQRSLKNVFSVVEVKYAGDLLYRQVDAKAEILGHPTAMQDALELGRSFVESSA